MKDTLEIVVEKAKLGDKIALEFVINNINDLVYNLSLKMLLYPDDAKDATQEILIKVLTHLSTFNQKSTFKTWVYRVATNYLDIDRMVYILSEILEFTSVEGSKILGITSDSFRKKLSRSRTKIRNFLNNKCGLANAKNPCRCSKKIDFLIDQDIVNPKDLRFAHYSNRSIDLVNQIGDLEKSIAIYRLVPDFPSPESILKEMKTTLRID